MIITGFPVSVVSIILDRYSEKLIEKEKSAFTSLRYLFCLSIVLGIKDVTRYVRIYFVQLFPANHKQVGNGI